jgi:hypothetical protein
MGVFQQPAKKGHQLQPFRYPTTFPSISATKLASFAFFNSSLVILAISRLEGNFVIAASVSLISPASAFLGF